MKRRIKQVVLSGLGLILVGCVAQQQWKWIETDAYRTGQDVTFRGTIVEYEGVDDLLVMDTGQGQWVILDAELWLERRKAAPGWQVEATGNWGRDARNRPVLHAYIVSVLARPAQPTTKPTNE